MDYYELLGVSRAASQEEIKRAFHSRVLVTHPDVNQGNATAGQETRRLIEAYRTLSDPRARRRYDLFTTPIVLDRPVTVPTTYVVDRSTPRQSAGKIWVFLALIILVIGLVMSYHNQNERMVFRPFLINGELPYSTSVKQFPLVVEPGLDNHVEWYHTQRYQLTLADPWATHQMIHTYNRAAKQALSEGDTSRAQFYKSAIENAGRLYL